MSYVDKVLNETLGELAESAKQMKDMVTVESITQTDVILNGMEAALAVEERTSELFDNVSKKHIEVGGRIRALSDFLLHLLAPRTDDEQKTRDFIVILLERMAGILAAIGNLKAAELSAAEWINVTKSIIRILDVMLDTLDTLERARDKWKQ